MAIQDDLAALPICSNNQIALTLYYLSIRTVPLITLEHLGFDSRHQLIDRALVRTLQLTLSIHLE